MHFGKKNKKFAYTMLDADLNRIILTMSNLERDLGILVSHNLSWENQVNSAVFKASRSLDLIKSTFKNIDCKTFKIVYSSMIRSNLEYGVNVWNPYLKKSINKMEGVQRRATKMVKKICKMDYVDRLRFLKLNDCQLNHGLAIFRLWLFLKRK